MWIWFEMKWLRSKLMNISHYFTYCRLDEASQIATRNVCMRLDQRWKEQNHTYVYLFKCTRIIFIYIYRYSADRFSAAQFMKSQIHVMIWSYLFVCLFALHVLVVSICFCYLSSSSPSSSLSLRCFHFFVIFLSVVPIVGIFLHYDCISFASERHTLHTDRHCVLLHLVSNVWKCFLFLDIKRFRLFNIKLFPWWWDVFTFSR